jgi:hypothetical protein
MARRPAGQDVLDILGEGPAVSVATAEILGQGPHHDVIDLGRKAFDHPGGGKGFVLDHPG